MDEYFITCARPPMVETTRANEGAAAAHAHLDEISRCFAAVMEDVALGVCGDGDEWFALIPMASRSSLGAQLGTLVQQCALPHMLDIAVGVTVGALEVDPSRPWQLDRNSDILARARAIARIAAPGQVLVDEHVRRALPEVDGFVPEQPHERSLIGLRGNVEVSVAPWGDPEQTEIWNLALLRPELKKVENTTANLLMGCDDVGQALQTFDEKRSDAALREVRNCFKRVASHSTELLAYVETSKEISGVRVLTEGFAALKGTVDTLLPACDQAKSRIGSPEQKTAYIDLAEPWDNLVAILRKIHLDADQLIMNLDDGLKSGQPAAWGY